MSISKIKVGSTEHDLQASKLTTARTIALGTGATGTATSFDGSANITIPVTSVKEAYLEWGGKDIAASFSALDAALIEDLSANRLAGLPSSKVTFERSSNGGSTWTAYTGPNGRALVTTSSGGSACNANTASSQSVNNWHRITIDVSGYVYCELRKIAMWLSTAGAGGCQCKVEWGDYSSETVWTTEKTVSVNGWSGWNIINVSRTIGNSTYGKTKYIRLTFSQTGVSSGNSSNLPVYKVRFYSNNCWSWPSNLANNGHVYSYDSDLNVTFPGQVTALNGVSLPNSTNEDYINRGILFSSGAKIGTFSAGGVGIYAGNGIWFRTDSLTSASGKGVVLKSTEFYPTPTNAVNLGTSGNCWKNIYGTTIYENGTALSSKYSAKGHTHSVTAKGTVSQPTFTGTAHNHTFSGSSVNSGKPDTTNVTTIYSITDVGSLPSHTYTAPSLTGTVDKQCLTLTFSAGSHSFSAGSLPKRSSAISMPNTNHTHAVTAAGTIGNTTAGGTVSQPTFEGIAVTSGSDS